ncbi:MAG: aminotransferase class III-fold pyridoxal phosphate-dependent enzyme [Desulfarculaceae bacterium]|nr:aminotransferase class III-fold pyridoxal phosphate-dependent enzyme [Desulfarculaceae bacterium]MCF8071288.1 aminotransferase class III-fold pyridoxal phosphate-dependent enzyme [Desulfarculaceae bacterium]MCF8101613.1 aminotransferase class III-fold pyridoxal phosphate-dependent enzyme [Desulfarculaceae bacterium]MCF8117447.1 aminotransferase class III-fold pyridoxal phosphate-dependent enzyme [Desulfarculaceae bacterium]
MTNLLGYPGFNLDLPQIVRAENTWLYDAQGKRYVDLESGLWCAGIGHGHPRVIEALTRQAGQICHAGYSYNAPVVDEAAAEVLETSGLAGGKCIFLCSGSEAVEFSIRAVRQAASQPLLLTFTDSYFGAYGDAHRKSGDEWFLFDWADCAGCPLDRVCGPDCPAWQKIPLSKIGGFLFEPGSSSGLVRFPPSKLVAALAAQMKKNGGWLLVNEVTTGLGRTGEWFGYQHYGLAPDVVALGKGLGNGYPVSAALLSPGLLARLEANPVHYAQSHQNDPLGAAVALAVVRAIKEEGLIARGREISRLLLEGLADIKQATGKIREIRGRGLMVAVELTGDKDAASTARARRGLLARGYIVAQRPGLNVIRLDPALTMERAEIAGFLSALQQVLEQEVQPPPAA